jgi:hypothetical protein
MNKMIKALALLASAILMGVSAPVMAQTAAATPAAPSVTVDGLVDAYYTYNFTNAAHGINGAGNIGQFWNTSDNSFSLGLAETKITAKQGNATAVVELAYQDAANLGLPSGTNLDVLQAYAQYTTGAWTLTAGRFTTWMGNEVVEPTSNFNYSHSLLFWYTIPVWNQGISASYAVDSTLSITGYATDGYNTNLTSGNGFTYGGEVAWTPNSTWKFVLNGIDGPGQVFFTGAAKDKWVGEFIASYAPTSDWTFVLDAEYGAQDLGFGEEWNLTPTSPNITVNSLDFWGAALYAKYAISSDWSAALRVEELKDVEGQLGIYGMFAPGPGWTDEAREATLTVTHAVTPAWTITAEGRYDYEPTFLGTTPSNTGGTFAGASNDQLTATLSTAFVF